MHVPGEREVSSRRHRYNDLRRVLALENTNIFYFISCISELLYN